MTPSLAKEILCDRSGNFGLLSALLIVPLILAVGSVVDFSQALEARTKMQNMADAAALAAAASSEKDTDKLRNIAAQFIRMNTKGIDGEISLSDASSFDSESSTVMVVLDYRMPTTFMKIVGKSAININVFSEAAREGGITSAEIALVLDTTYSMTAMASATTSRLDALKRIAKDFVAKTMVMPDVRVAVVPYADYVNVGKHRRNAVWADVRPDWDHVIPDKLVYSRWECKAIPATQSCLVDGVKTWGASCPEVCGNVSYPKGVIEKGWTDRFRFHGCMFSRLDNSVRLTQDAYGTKKYTGAMYTVPMCWNELLPLTNVQKTVTAKIDSLATADISVPSWMRFGIETYIPTGLQWGWNALSSHNYFPEGFPNPDIKKKVLILLSDGANTAVFEDPKEFKNFNDVGGQPYPYGQHRIAADWEKQIAAERAKFDRLLVQTNADMLTLCSNIKKDGIEIFTISFGEDDAEANAKMKACATTPDRHFFHAVNTVELSNAFGTITSSMGGTLRLIR